MCVYALTAAAIRPLVTKAIGRFGQGKALAFAFTMLVGSMLLVARLMTTGTSDTDYMIPLILDAFCLAPMLSAIAGGTGSNFALLPPENATGNFVKIVQRVPVKILLDRADKNPNLLGPGMSVEATVTIHAPPRWLTPFL
jgi:hypothetical protein